jgi:hypothetical protein
MALGIARSVRGAVVLGRGTVGWRVGDHGEVRTKTCLLLSPLVRGGAAAAVAGVVKEEASALELHVPVARGGGCARWGSMSMTRRIARSVRGVVVVLGRRAAC